ncbi:MAG: HD domain-containing protein [Defluviitaleaceae bacterium]|nr:HD domain-containing protein [Defluviitaleaceae bacterium]
MNLQFKDSLISNMEEFKQLEYSALPARLSASDLMAHLRERAETKGRLLTENNAIINGKLRPVLSSIKSIDEKNVDELYSFAQTLFSLSSALDMGLSLEIHEALVAWGKSRGDIDRWLRSLYSAGLIYSHFNDQLKVLGNVNFLEKAAAAFEEGSAFKKQYFELENKETRLLVHRFLSGTYLVYISYNNETEYAEGYAKFAHHFDTAMEFWANEDVRALDPDFPWANFMTNAHQNMCNWLPVIRKQPPETRDMTLAQKVYDSYIFLTEQDETGFVNKHWPPQRTNYVRILATYCVGIISYDEALSQLREMFYSADPNDYSNGGLLTMTFIPHILIEHLNISKTAANNILIKSEIKDIVFKMAEYCKNIPDTIDRQLFNRTIATVSKHFSQTLLNFDHFTDSILSLTTYAHLPTYVHSVMVSKVTIILAEHFLKHNPEYFAGMYGATNAQTVLSVRKNILNLLARAALCHDIGKVFYITAVALASRKLYDFEFGIIKEHTSTSVLFEPASEKMKFITDVMRGHHKWHNNQGYPESFDNAPLPYKFAIDLISIADSIEAATDNLGRSYARALTLDQVIAEILQQAGTRYNPIIADALANPDLRGKISHCLNNEREITYYEVYKSATRRKQGATRVSS